MINDNPPFREKCTSYGDCRKPKHYQPGMRVPIYKNTTDLNAQNSGNPSTVDGTTGVSTVAPIHATGSYGSGGDPSCGDYSGANCAGGQYNGDNYSSAGYFCGPWTPRLPINTYAGTLEVLGITVTNGGTGYTNGDTMTVIGGSPDSAATFSIKVAAGVIQSATLISAGVYPTDPASLTTATPTAGGTGATFAFTSTTALQDFGSCNLVGWAAVCSMRRWHGRTPYNNWDGLATETVVCTPTTGPDQHFAYEPDRSTQSTFTLPQVKYLALTITMEHKLVSTCYPTVGPAPYDNIETRAVHINPNSGETVFDSCSASLGDTTLESMWTSSGIDQSALYAACIGCLGPTISVPTGGSISSADAVSGWIKDSSGNILEEWKCDFANGLFYRHHLGNVANSCITGPGGTAVWGILTGVDVTITATTLTIYTTIHTGEPGTDVAYQETSTWTATLSSANNASDIIASAESNYQPWHLLDRTMMPLSTQNWKGIMPKVTQNELPSDVVPDVSNLTPTLPDYRSWNSGTSTWNTMTWIDLTVWYFQISGALSNDAGSYSSGSTADSTMVKFYDGSVLGLPNPVGGRPEDYFDGRYLDYQKCGPADDDWYTYGYQAQWGGWNGGAGADLPPQATQWTNLWEASQLAIGRQRLYGPQFAPWGGVVVTKYVETGVRLPSFNHARPFGSDRSLFDETNVGCILDDGTGNTEFDGTNVPLKNTMNVTPGEQVFIYGTGLDGIYPVATGGAGSGTFTVGTKISGLPSWFSYWDDGSSIDDSTHGIVLVQRFPNCAPFGGRLAVQSVTDNHDGTVTVVTDATPVLIDEAVPSATTFPVDFTDAGMNPLLTNSTVTTSSVTTFKVTATYATISGAKWVTLYGALDGDPGIANIAKWYWNDTSSKGNMVSGEWLLDFRTNAEYERLTGIIACPSGSCPATTTSGNELEWPGGTGPPAAGTCTTQVTQPTQNTGYLISNTSLTDECKGFVGCSPFYIVFSPHSADTPPTGLGVRIDFTTTITLDPRYSSKQSLDVSQAMTDPLYQSPHTPCGNATVPSGHSWAAENGFASGNWIVDSNGNRQTATSGFGTTGATEPVWNTTLGGTTTDGSVTWELTAVHVGQPSCVPFVETRAALPYSTSSTSPPDNGAGIGQNQPAPSGGYFKDYTMVNPAVSLSGNVVKEPSPTDQPIQVFAPSGIFTPC